MICEFLFKYPLELFRQGEIGFAWAMPGEVRALILAAAGALAWWLYRRSPVKVAGRRGAALVALRGGALAVVATMLLCPVLRLPKLSSDPPFLAVLVDSSRSMTVEDAASGAARFVAAKHAVFDHGGLAADLSDRFAVRAFSFAEGARRVADPSRLTADGERTNLFRALRDVDDEMRGLPLAGVVLLSDGGDNGSGSALEMAGALKAAGVPLFTVGFGGPAVARDHEVVRVEAPAKVRRNARVQALATVRCAGYDQPFSVTLRQGTTTAATVEVRPQPGKELYQVPFEFFPDHDGQQKYEVAIEPEKDERITDNNRRAFFVEVADERLPVLYVEGSPRTEFRFIRRAMLRDREFRIVSLLRTGHGRFYVQGGDDMPELAKGFPATKEQLYRFEAIILGDIEAGFFTREQLELIEGFVKERGGGCAMLGGVNSFGLGGWRGTPCEAMLPVLLGAVAEPYSFDRVPMRVTDDGLRHPIMHQEDDAEANKIAWGKVPDLDGSNPVTGAKTAAQVLALNPKTGKPVLAVQNYGRGRVAAFCTGGAWQWRMSLPTESELQERFWRQLVRWVAVGSKESISLALDRAVYAQGEPVILRATVLGASLEGVDDAKVTATFRNPFGNTEEVQMPWTLSADGVYECRYETREAGDHAVVVHVEIPGMKGSDSDATFGVIRPDLELNGAGLNDALLGRLAAAGGGAYLPEREFSRLEPMLRSLPDPRLRNSPEIEEKDLWDAPIFFILLVLLLGVEWSLRRRGGLA